jgi:D-xylulose reductase
MNSATSTPPQEKTMDAVVLERQHEIQIRPVPGLGPVGPGEVRIGVHTVGICGSDVHYYTHGRIGPYVVEAPMVLGHEAAGTVLEIGAGVTHLAVGDRVCMEPGIPNPRSRASRAGMYNVDPDVRFWATPPVHGCLQPEVVHPADFTYKLPDELSLEEGALIEPFAVAVHAVTKARIAPGDVVAVVGAGTIGVLTAIAAAASGASRVYISDVAPEKLAKLEAYPTIHPADVTRQELADVVREATDWGADVVFEASGNPRAFGALWEIPAPGGTVVLVGIPVEPVPLDVAAAQARELRIETVFRYANAFPRAIELAASPAVDLGALISAVYPLGEAVTAFERGAEARPTDTKIQIRVAGA